MYGSDKSKLVNANERLEFCIAFKSASDYMDSMDNTSSASSRTDNYTYIRITKSYDAGTYLRPIAAVPNGGICAGCSLIVLSLK